MSAPSFPATFPLRMYVSAPIFSFSSKDFDDLSKAGHTRQSLTRRSLPSLLVYSEGIRESYLTKDGRGVLIAPVSDSASLTPHFLYSRILGTSDTLLHSFLPQARPGNSVDCDMCGGSGEYPWVENLPCRFCFGRGWESPAVFQSILDWSEDLHETTHRN